MTGGSLKTITSTQNKKQRRYQKMSINISKSELYHDVITTDKETAEQIFQQHKKTASLFHYFGYSEIPLYRVTWRKNDNVITKGNTPRT